SGAGVLEIGDDAVLDVHRRGGADIDPDFALRKAVDGEAAKADDVARARTDGNAAEGVTLDDHLADSVIANVDGLRDAGAGVDIRGEEKDLAARQRASDGETQRPAG